MALQPTPDQKIDRQTTTPFLLRLYYRTNAFHSPSEFTTVPPSPSLQQSSLQIYTWPTCTLSELTSLLSGALPDLLPTPAVGTRIGYRLLFPDTRSVAASGGDSGPGRWLSKELGSIVIGAATQDDNDDDDAIANGHGNPLPVLGLGRLDGDADKTLADARFVIGDYISCAVLPPLSDGSVAPLPPTERAFQSSGRGMGGPREGGYGRGGYGGRPENGLGGGYRGARGGRGADRSFGGMNVPSGEWRRGERLPEGPSGGGGYGRGRGRPRPY